MFLTNLADKLKCSMVSKGHYSKENEFRSNVNQALRLYFFVILNSAKHNFFPAKNVEMPIIAGIINVYGQVK